MQYFDYHSKFGDLDENMYHGHKRYMFFTTKEGKDLLKYNGMGLILKINDYICVHGSFTGFRNFLSDKDFNTLQKINDICLKHIFKDEKNDEQIDGKYMEFILGNKGLLMDRTYGDVDLMSIKYNKDKTDKLEDFNKNFCENILIKNLKEVCDDETCNNNIKIIIGHCPQFKFYNSNYKLQGFEHESNDNDIQSLKPLFKPISYKDYHYGISHSCSDPNQTELDPRLFRVDIGLSRAFDIDILKTMSADQLYNIFKSRSPQVLIIDSTSKPNKARVRRSTLKNAFIHHPRSWLQNTELETEILKIESINKNQAGGNFLHV
jgi:hypothetical protein